MRRLIASGAAVAVAALAAVACAPPPAPTPRIDELSTRLLPRGTSSRVTITGSGLSGAAEVDAGTGLVVSDLHVTSARQAEVTVTDAGADPTVAHDVAITVRGRTATCGGCLHILGDRLQTAPDSVISVAGAPFGQSGLRTLTLSGADGGLGAAPQPGDVISTGVGPQTPRGFLGRVRSAAPDGSNLDVVTEPISVFEAVPSGSFDLASSSPAALRAAAANDSSGGASGSATQPLAQAVSCSAGGSLELSGSVSVGVGVGLSMTWDDSTRAVTDSTFDVTATQSAQAQAQVSGSASCALEETEVGPEHFLPTVEVQAGPVPTFITPSIQFFVSADAAVNGAVTTGASESASVSVGAHYDGAHTTPTSSSSVDFSASPPTLDADAHAGVRFSARLTMYVDWVGGPQSNLDGTLDLSANRHDDPCWKLTAGADAGLSLVVPALHLSEGFPSLVHEERDLASGNLPFCDNPDNPGDPGEGDGRLGGGDADPHMTTFDGLHYDLHAAGELVLARSTTDDFATQIRTHLSPNHPVGLTDQLAVRAAGHTVVVSADAATTLDGQAIVPHTTYELGSGATLRNNLVRLGDGTTVNADAHTWEGGGYLDYRIRIAPGRAGHLAGLLGTYDDDPADDLTTADGTTTIDPDTLATDAGRDQFYDVFLPSWQPAPGERLLPGEPRQYERVESPPELDSATTEQLASALTTCTASGWTNDNGLDKCVYDVVVTGDAAFAAPSAQQAGYSDGTFAANAPQVAEVLTEVPADGALHSYDIPAATLERFATTVPAGQVLVADAAQNPGVVLTADADDGSSFTSISRAATPVADHPVTWIVERSASSTDGRAAFTVVAPASTADTGVVTLQPDELRVFRAPTPPLDITLWTPTAPACVPSGPAQVTVVQYYPVRSTIDAVAGCTVNGLIGGQTLVVSTVGTGGLTFRYRATSSPSVRGIADGDTVDIALTTTSTLGDDVPSVVLPLAAGQSVTITPADCPWTVGPTPVSVTAFALPFFPLTDILGTPFVPANATCAAPITLGPAPGAGDYRFYFGGGVPGELAARFDVTGP
jgi:hypothetical protein